MASAFPDGRPEEPAGDTDAAEAEADATNPLAGAMAATGEDETAAHEHLAEGELQLIVVADTDLLADRMWAQSQRLFGQLLVTEFASNGAFVINALEILAGSSDLMSLRGRAAFSRPFERVNELRLEAEEQFRRTENELQEELARTEERLAELQESREDQLSFSLSPEQEEELEKFTAERLRIRSDLREVRRNLDASIERLGAVLKGINIGLVPLLIGVGGLAAAAARRRRRNGGGS